MPKASLTGVVSKLVSTLMYSLTLRYKCNFFYIVFSQANYYITLLSDTLITYCVRRIRQKTEEAE